MLNDWHLKYGSTDLAFGTVASGFVIPQGGAPAISNQDITDQDAARPRGDGVLFGTDYRNGTTVTFDLLVDGGADEAASYAKLQTLATAWRADEVRANPGSMATLQAHTGRVAFGRPRRFQPDYDLSPFGVTGVTCDFATADDMWYGPSQTTTVNLVPRGQGGLIAPLASPLATTKSSDRSQVINVNGLLPIWPVIQINGPITNPSVEVVGQFKASFNLTLAYDQTLTIDTRPWARSILRGRASAAGSLDPRGDRLSDMQVAPGRHELVLRGTSATGTPRALFTWRDAFPTY